MASKVTTEALTAFAAKVDEEGDFHGAQALADTLQRKGHTSDRASLIGALRAAMLMTRAYADLGAAISFHLALEANREALEAKLTEELRSQRAG